MVMKFAVFIVIGRVLGLGFGLGVRVIYIYTPFLFLFCMSDETFFINVITPDAQFAELHS